MTSTIIPGLRYRHAPAAIEFLCAAFGFARHAVYADEADPSMVHHAQLTLGGGMVMLGSGTPAAGESGISIYVYVPDVAAHCAQARAAGAEIVTALHENEGYPGQGYSARDPEGYVWSFGSYDPWVE